MQIVPFSNHGNLLRESFHTIRGFTWSFIRQSIPICCAVS